MKILITQYGMREYVRSMVLEIPDDLESDELNESTVEHLADEESPGSWMPLILDNEEWQNHICFDHYEVDEEEFDGTGYTVHKYPLLGPPLSFAEAARRYRDWGGRGVPSEFDSFTIESKWYLRDQAFPLATVQNDGTVEEWTGGAE